MLPDRSILIGQKLVENAKIKMRHFEEFSNNVYVSNKMDVDLKKVLLGWWKNLRMIP